MNQNETSFLVNAVLQNAQRLGLTWTIRFGTVESVSNDITYVVLDGAVEDSVAQMAVPLGGAVPANARVSCLLTSPTDIFIIASDPDRGTPVVRWRNTNSQSIPDAGSGTFVQWTDNDLDVFGDFSSGGTTFTPEIAGWYQFVGRAAFAANATSRRGAFLNRNATTSGADGIGGVSLQAPATGTAQLTVVGMGYMNGDDDTMGLRVIQNSGGALALSTSDGGSMIEGIYLGSPVTT